LHGQLSEGGSAHRLLRCATPRGKVKLYERGKQWSKKSLSKVTKGKMCHLWDQSIREIDF
jgi:hypothetical protein